MTNNEKNMKKVNIQDVASANMVQQNVQQIKTLFPEAVTEDGMNFDTLRQLLGDLTVLDEGEEKYGLNWHGKKRARHMALTPSLGTLLPCPEESVDWDTTQNLFIEGDNLEVLKCLQKSYANKVKMIYIDPPYNTGKEFIYPDKFQDNLDTYLKYTGQVDDDGMKFTSNTETSGRKHTNWLNMMYPRLKLARNLLRDDGVIFISIDDNEQANLKEICDEIFGEENFIGQITALSNPKGRVLDKYIANCHEYLFVYSKNPLETGALSIYKSIQEIIKDYVLEDSDGRYRELELRNTHREFGKHNRPNLYYPFYIQSDGNVHLENEANSNEVYPIWDDGHEGCWTWSKDKAREEITDLIAKKVKGNWKIYRKSYANRGDKVPSKKLKSIWSEKEFYTEKGQSVFNKIFDTKEKIFQSPKSVDYIKQTVSMATNGKEEVVIDFFAGSATTAHAVMQLNAEDGGNRKCIMVQLPERLDDTEKNKKNNAEAIKFLQSMNKPITIAEISKERIRRAAKKIKEEHPNYTGDLGFKVFKLDRSNMNAWDIDPSNLSESLYNHTVHLVEGRSEQDILYELLLKRGVDLTTPIETKQIASKNVYSIGYGKIITCLDGSITRDDVEPLATGIVEWQKELKTMLDVTTIDTHVFFKDCAFNGNDVAKANMVAILDQHGIPHVQSL